MLAPVIIFVYNRFEHTIETVEALAKNDLAKETEVYIFADAAKNKKSVNDVEQVREYLDSLNQRTLFKSLTINKAEVNKGLAKSVISGVSEIFERYDKVIVLEDDLVSSQDFLQYMNDALDYYDKNKKIWSISGYTFDIKKPSNYESDIYLSYRGCSWGWATWKNRWEKTDWDVCDYEKFKSNKRLIQKFNRGGRDMSNMLEMQMQNKLDSWAIRWCYTQSKLDMLTVYPIISRIKNIGLDGSGTHSGISSHYDTVINTNNNKCRFDDPGLNEIITRNFSNHFITPVQYFKSKIKKAIKKFLRWG